ASAASASISPETKQESLLSKLACFASNAQSRPNDYIKLLLSSPLTAAIGNPRARPLPAAAAAPRPQSAHLCPASCSRGGWNTPVPPNSSELGRSPQGKR